MTDMIERVARAISRELGVNPDQEHYAGLSDRTYHEWQQFEGAARAAIEAMREPSEAMLDASDAAVWKHITDPRPSRTAWLAMIDGALNHTGEPK